MGCPGVQFHENRGFPDVGVEAIRRDAIFGFDLTPNKTGVLAVEVPWNGALELNAEFNPVNSQNLMVIVVLIYADKFVISKNGTFSSV